MRDASRIAGYNFSLADIKNWLNKQITFLVHKPRPKFIQLLSQFVEQGTIFHKGIPMTDRKFRFLATSCYVFHLCSIDIRHDNEV
ncbi:hypothetical protein Glove_505g66 [Diversispora epigaea]|uniref:Uncharacterized protein n=1 Tax=Diversispora epigaea TaxID=1348612 RepID=A0A397GIX0_9GLOM|nr:hypothetical protein Glove_505g66 [Diversispora epigaea]